jgi:hypothetical protein
MPGPDSLTLAWKSMAEDLQIAIGAGLEIDVDPDSGAASYRATRGSPTVDVLAALTRAKPLVLELLGGHPSHRRALPHERCPSHAANPAVVACSRCDVQIGDHRDCAACVRLTAAAGAATRCAWHLGT